MVMETEIKATIVAWVDKSSFNDWVNYARDTWKKLDAELKKKLELNVVSFQLKLAQARQLLKQAKKDWDKNATINAQLKTNQLQRWLTEAKRSLNNYVNTWETWLSRLQAKFNQLWQWIKASFMNMVSAAAIFSVAMSALRWIISFFWSAVDKSIAFEKSMSNVATLVDTSVESIDDMGKALLDVAKSVPVSVEDLTSALYDIRSAWIWAWDAMDVLKQSAKLAVAGLGTTKEAVDVVTSAMNSFVNENLTASEAANSFFLAVKYGKTTIAELADGFGDVSWIAAQTGVKFNELIAAVSALTTTGLKANVAYTQIKGILDGVLKASDWVKNKFKEMWISFDVASLSTKWLAVFVKDIKDRFDELWYSTAKQSELFSEMFPNVRALSGILSLTWANAEAFNKTLKDMAINTTAFAKAYEQQANTVAAKIQVLNNKLDEQKIILWDNFSLWRVVFKTIWLWVVKTINYIVWLGKISVQIFKDMRGAFIATAANISFSIISAFGKALSFIKWLLWWDLIPEFTIPKVKVSVTWWTFTKTKDLIKEVFGGAAEEWAKEVLKWNKIIEDWFSDLGESIDDSTSWAGASVNALAKDFEDAFVQIGKDIEKSGKQIEKYKWEIEDLNDSIDDLWKQKDIDVASRVATIDAELAKTGDLAVTSEERAKLEAERAEAFAWLTDKEIEALDALILKKKEYNDLSDIGKILEDYKIEKDALDIKLQETEERLAIEEQYNQDLFTAKEKMSDDYTAKYQSNINKEIVANDALIVSYNQVAIAARAAALAMLNAKFWSGTWDIAWFRATGWPVSAGSPYIVWEQWPERFVPNVSWTIVPNNELTNNININANVSNDIELDALANALAKKIALSRKGIF